MPSSTLPPVRPPRASAEDRYRAVLQAIACGRPGTNRPIRSVEVQDLARRALIEMDDDWTRRGMPANAENK